MGREARASFTLRDTAVLRELRISRLDSRYQNCTLNCNIEGYLTTGRIPMPSEGRERPAPSGGAPLTMAARSSGSRPRAAERLEQWVDVVWDRTADGMAGSANALEVEALSVRLGDNDILRNLSFNLPRGRSLAVIGPNGAGKTVLLRALIGALPHTGVIRWASPTVLGYVPQKLDIERDLPLSGWDFLHAKAVVAKSSGEVEETLRRTGLVAAELLRPIGTMSGGQFQRLLVACALLGRPNVLLLDEVAAGVDAPGQAHLSELIYHLRQETGTTLIWVSHDLSVVYRYADTVLCLGQDLFFGPPCEALTPESLRKLYGAPVAFHVHETS